MSEMEPTAPVAWARPAVPRFAQRVPRQVLADLALLAVTLIWGGTFVMVKDAVASYPVFSFLTLRFAFACLALAPILLWQRQAQRRAPARPVQAVAARAHLLTWVPPGLIGCALFAGYWLQTAGLQLTTPAKAGFITGLAVVIVPLATATVLRRIPALGARIGVALATGGLALLTLQQGLTFAPGDLLVLGCAVAFALHILLTGQFAPQYPPLYLIMGQICVVTLFCGAAAALFDPRMPLTVSVVGAAAFTGVLATSLAFGVQTLAQRFTSVTHTALIFAAEPVFAALFSFLLIGELLGPRQWLGCALILAGMIAAEAIRGPAHEARAE